MNKNDGGPAFPMQGMRYKNAEGNDLDPFQGYGWLVDPVPGASLRDIFALGQLIAYRAHPANENIKYAHNVATYCYAMADAMLAARESQP